MTAQDRFISYTPSAGTTVLPFDFPVWQAEGLSVTLVYQGVRTALLEGSAYTISGLDDPAGGAITLAIPAGGTESYELQGATPIERISDYAPEYTPSGDQIDADNNLLIAIAQEQRRDITAATLSNASLRVPLGEGVNVLPAAALRKSKFLAFDNLGQPSLQDLTPFINLDALGVGWVSSRVLMANLPIVMLGVYLLEDGRSGLFRLKAGTPPVSDPQQALYVTSNTAGYYWQRERAPGELYLAWAGAAADGAADDLTKVNACIALLNDASNVASLLRLGAGAIALSGNPDPLTRSNLAVMGAGGGATTLVKLNTAVDKGGFFTLGVSAQISHLTLEGFTCDCQLNYTTITTDHALWFRFCRGVVVRDVNYVFVPQMWRFGEDATARDAQHVFIHGFDGQLRPNNGSLCIVGYNYSNVAIANGFLGITGTVRPNARILAVRPSSAGTGCDSLEFVNVTSNGQFLECDYGYEFDFTTNGISNVQLGNGVFDGGQLGTILLKLGAGQDATATRRLIGFQLTGMRVSSTQGSGGDCIRVIQDSNNAIIGVEAVGCVFNADNGRVFYHTAAVAIPVTSFSAVFTGNTYSDNGNSVDRPVFETQVGYLTLTGGRVQAGAEGNAVKFTNLVKATAAAASTLNVHNVDCARLNGAAILDLTAVSASNLNLTQVGGCSGKPQGALRWLQTTAAGTNTLAQTAALANGKYLFTGRVLAQKSDASDLAAYTFQAVVNVVAGSASISGSPVITELFETNASWTVSIDATAGAMARVRVTGVAATTINWSLVQYNLEMAQ